MFYKHPEAWAKLVQMFEFSIAKIEHLYYHGNQGALPQIRWPSEKKGKGHNRIGFCTDRENFFLKAPLRFWRGALIIHKSCTQKRGGGDTTKTDYITDAELEIVLALLMPQNRLICQLALHTGLRIGDVLAIRTAQLKPRLTIKERKTGKSRRITIPAKLLQNIKAQAGDEWAFPGRITARPKTRQAVWADIKRAQKAARLPANIGPHSLRKIYAVEQYRRYGDIHRVAAALNHSDPAITLLYAMADALTAARQREGQKRRCRPK